MSIKRELPFTPAKGNPSSQKLKDAKFEKMEPTQEILNEAVLQRDIYYKNAENDYGYFLSLAKVEKNVYNDNSVRVSSKLAASDENKVQITSIGTGNQDYTIIKYIATWEYDEYKYKLS